MPTETVTPRATRVIFSKLLGALGLVAAFAAPALAWAADAPTRRPNIVVILGDDLGYADIGPFGSEIRTPNLDSLAKDGVRFTNFYTHASCSPTRSMLLSGRRHAPERPRQHGRVDGAQPARRAVGYEGYLNNRVATLPQLLKDAGYHTYMVGKWHLGKAPDQIPAARGFERDFSLLDGAGSYWDMTNFTALRRPVGLHRGRALPDQAARRLLRDQDLHRQADRLHRRQPRRRQAVLRLRGAPGAARPLPPAEGVAQRATSASTTRAGTRCARSASKRQVELGIMPARHAALRAHVVRARSDRAGAGEPGAARQEDGALRRHGGEPRPPRRAPRSTT
jgi:arylsulfatase A-like enzyme